MTHYLNMLQAHTDEAYRNLLRRFDHVEFYRSLTGEVDDTGQEHLFVIVASR